MVGVQTKFNYAWVRTTSRRQIRFSVFFPLSQRDCLGC